MTNTPVPVVEVHTLKGLPGSYFDFRGTLAEALEWLVRPRRYGAKTQTPLDHFGWCQITHYIGELPGWQIVAIT